MSADLLVAGARRSWSQLNNYLTCGEQYRLERIEEVPQPPAIWFIGGTAFHTATEWLDKGEEDNPRHAWFKAWNDEFANMLRVGRDIAARVGTHADFVAHCIGQCQLDRPQAVEWREGRGPRISTDCMMGSRNFVIRSVTTTSKAAIQGTTPRISRRPRGARPGPLRATD